MVLPDPSPLNSPVSPAQAVTIEHYPFLGLWNAASLCRLEIHPATRGRIAVIATELPNNPGTSITNAAEILATHVCRDFAIPPDRLVWIEHYGYPTGTDRPREFSLVTFEHALPPPLASRLLGTRRQTIRHNAIFDGAQWRPMTTADWHDLGLPPREPVMYS
jgi:hypothetical protein